MTRYAMVIDTKTCIGCGDCVVACKTENKVPDGLNRDWIVEATSGNTGISFAALGRALGHPVTIFMPDWMSRERVDLIHSLDARIIPVTREQGGFVGSVAMAEAMAAEIGGELVDWADLEARFGQ